MIFALDRDAVLHLFQTEHDAQSALEAIAIENEEYEFCDLDGNVLEARITVPISAFCPGTFTLSRNDKSPQGFGCVLC